MELTKSLFIEDDCFIAADLDEATKSSIGYVAARWAYIEWLLRFAAHRAAGVDDQIGRVAFRDPRPDEMVTMIGDLAMLGGITLQTDLRALRALVEDLRSRRDRVVHGLWVINRSTLEIGVMDLTGSWNLGPRSPRMTRRMNPSVHPITDEYFSLMEADLDRAIQSLGQIHHELAAAQNTSLEKSVVQALKSYRLRDQNENKSPDRPPPSRG